MKTGTYHLTENKEMGVVTKKRKWKPTVLLAAVMTLAGSVAIPIPGVQTGEVVASEVKADIAQNQAAASEVKTQETTYSWDFRPEFYDKETGRAYYNASKKNG